MSRWWLWLLIFVVGLFLAIAVRRASRRLNGDVAEQREGIGSFFYYVLVDWWIDWL